MKRTGNKNQMETLVESLNAAHSLYEETKEESIKDAARGFIIFAEIIGIINKDTLAFLFDTLKQW